MGFQKIEKRAFSSHGPSTTPVTMTIGTNAAGHRARISIAEATAKTLNLKDGDKIEIAIGTDRDAGWLRVKKSDDGFTLRASNKKGGALGRPVPRHRCLAPRRIARRTAGAEAAIGRRAADPGAGELARAGGSRIGAMLT